MAQPRPGGKWHLDEVFIRIGGKQHDLWRAVDQDGHVLDILVQSRRTTKAAKRFFRKLLRGLQRVPRVIVTDKLGSYAAAKRTILPHVEHRQSKYLNNQTEVPHQPTRRRARQMQRFKSARHAQQFLSAHACIQHHFSSAAIASPPTNTVPPALPLSAPGARSAQSLTSHSHQSRPEVIDTLHPST